IVTGKEIRRAQPVRIEEVLRRVPGVVVRQSYAGGSRLDVSIRGVDGGRSRRVLILEDGIPISLNPYSEPDLYHAPAVEWLRGVEVVKGSGNILFGPQTLAGTLNLLTTLPPDKPTARADLDVGTYGYTRALASYGDALGDARYVVQALHRSGDGFRVQPFSSTDGMMKVAIPTWKDGEAMIKLQVRRETASSDDVGLTSAMWARDPRRPTLKPDDELVFERYAASITHKQRMDDDTKLTTLAYAYRTGRKWRRQDYTRSPVPGVAYERIAGDLGVQDGSLYFGSGNTVLDRTYDVMGVEPRLEHRFATDFVGHTVDVGGRVLYETADSAQRAGTTTTTYGGASQYAEARGTTGMGAYIQDRIAFRPDLLVTPGIRLEHARYARTILRQDLGSGPQDIDVRGTRDATGIIPGVGMIYGKKRAHVFGGLHAGYAPPRFTNAINANGFASNVKG
ncbi:MAG: TonB-dependent receptor, partial [Phycisphaerales bacterium]|nr:TonB-dependent receptor [Phycisphaerales bacterium]